jgi:hypothetical protein
MDFTVVLLAVFVVAVAAFAAGYFTARNNPPQ